MVAFSNHGLADIRSGISGNQWWSAQKLVTEGFFQKQNSKMTGFTSEEIREKLSKALDYSKKAFHIGWIPLVIYFGTISFLVSYQLF